MSGPPPSAALAGISFALIGMALIAVQDGFMKAYIGPFSLWLLMASRGVMAVIWLVPLIVVLGGKNRLLTPLWPLHLARSALIGVGFAMFYASFPFMGLAEISAIFFSSPLMIALIAAIWLREPIGPHRAGALLVGFIGVVIALTPTSEAFRPVALLPFAAAFLYALAQVLARKIGDRETGATTGLYTNVMISLLVIPLGFAISLSLPEATHLRWDWQMPRGADLMAIATLGTLGAGGNIFLARAYQVANASLVAPFDYSYLPMAALMAWLVWAEVPPANTLIGMGLIVSGGLYLGWRELRAHRRVKGPHPIAPMAVTPVLVKDNPEG